MALEGKDRTIRLSRDLLLLGTVKGLNSDSNLVESIFRDFGPRIIALHISPEELQGLRDHIRDGGDTRDMSQYDVVYSRKLSRYGSIGFPSPSLTKALELAQDLNAEVLSLDLDDEAFSDAYTEKISGLTMIRSSMRLKSINRNRFPQKTPEEFIIEWDRKVNGQKAFRELEEQREAHMAKRIIEIARKGKRTICLLELERMDGIANVLRKKAPDYFQK